MKVWSGGEGFAVDASSIAADVSDRTRVEGACDRTYNQTPSWPPSATRWIAEKIVTKERRLFSENLSTHWRSKAFQEL
jgi:hypothetical protein